MSHIRPTLLLASLLAGAAQPALAQETQSARQQERTERQQDSSSDWHLYALTGFSYSNRDPEGEEATNYYRVPIGLRVSNGRFRLSASIPYLFVKGPATVVDDDDDNSGGAILDESRQGIGDLNITARYRIPEKELGGIELDLMGRVKVPTASRSKGLGTGEVDFATGAELSHDFSGIEPFVSGQYRINGDPPGTNYRNSVWVSAGSGFRISKRTRGSLAWDYHQSRIRGRAGSHYLDAGLSTRLTRTFTLSGSSSIGLSSNATDFRAGATITARLF